MKCWGVILCEHYYLVCLLFKVSKFCSSGILQVPTNNELYGRSNFDPLIEE